MPQPEGRLRAPLAAYVDRQFLEGKTKGYRFADMPQPAEAWKRALAALDEVSVRTHGRPFAFLTGQDQDAMLGQMAEEYIRGRRHARNAVQNLLEFACDPRRRRSLLRATLRRGARSGLAAPPPRAAMFGYLHLANRFPAYWRSVYLRSGVSPLLPQVLVILGLYAWFWFNLHGLALFGDDRPVLPRVDDLPQYETAANKHEEAHAEHTQVVKVFRIFSQEGAGQNIEANGLPLGKRYVKSLAVTVPFSLLALGMAMGEPSLRTLGDRRFGVMIFGFVGLCIGLILADTFQLMNTWSELRRLLVFLDRLRLRRTLANLRGLYGGSVWKLSGNVLEERYHLISRQFESLRNLRTALDGWIVTSPDDAQRKRLVTDQLTQCDEKGRAFVTWYVNLLDDQYTGPDKESNVEAIATFQKMLAATAGCVMKLIIMPAWQSESQSLIRATGAKEEAAAFEKLVADLPPHLSAAEEFFLLPYMGFVRNILGRVRTLGLAVVTLFIAVTLCVSSYPFDPLPVIGTVFLVLFALVGVVMIVTYAEMMRDTTLSRIASTNPGELGWSFWVKMIGLGAGPLLALLTTLFPSMTDFIVSFLQPGAQAIK